MHPKEKRALAFDGDRVVSIGGIRRQNLPYIIIWIIYYAWVVSFTTWWTASPLTEEVFSTDFRSLLHTVNLISSALFVFIIRKEWFVKTARSGAVLVIVALGMFLIAPNGYIELLCVAITGAALGIINTSILMPFVFTLSNTEKLYAVVGSNILINLISIFQEGDIRGDINGYVEILLPLAMLVVALSIISFFKEKHLPKKVESLGIDTPIFHSRIYLTLLFNCFFVILCKGVGKGILNTTAFTSEHPILMLYSLGGLAGCVLYLAIYAFTKMPFIWLGNITFASFAMGLFCNALSFQMPGMDMVFSILLGVGSTIGMINVYYILGVVGKKYNSMRYLRMSLLFIGICGGVSGVAMGNFIHYRNTFEISIIASMVSVAVMLLFIMLSVVVSQSQYYDDWAKDSEKMDIDNEQLYLFKKYNLSKREIEVVKLLLQGYTMRQVSGILSIAYSTVNTYCTSAYRKLDINSKAELLLLFKDYRMK